MSVFKKSMRWGLALSLSLFVCACSDDNNDELSSCNIDKEMECLQADGSSAAYRLCSQGEWLAKTCEGDQLCFNGACHEPNEERLCEADGLRCLDANTVEDCKTSEPPTIKSCQDGYFCHAEACATGDCCVDALICEADALRCLDKNTVEDCKTSELPTIKSCQDGYFCHAEACATGDCCVVDERCKRYGSRCLDSQTVEHCKTSELPKVEDCADGYYCNADACADGDACCQPIEACKANETTCYDPNTLEVCVQGDVPRLEACPDSELCIDGVCVEDLCKNNRLDDGEEGIDCGGDCPPCAVCKVDGDCENHEVWDGRYCRADGRCSPKVFETVWVVGAEDTSVVLPFDPQYPDASCDFQILWGDEADGTDITSLSAVTDCNEVGNRSHVYAGPGKYHVKIIGTYDGWGAFDLINMDGQYRHKPAAMKLREVVSFGPVGLGRSMFHGARALSKMPERDIPDAGKLVTLSKAFSDAKMFNAPIGHWDTSNVTDMSYTFEGAEAFDQGLAAWHTSKVTTMRAMFHAAESFNHPVETWHTSYVKDMQSMFSAARSFNQALADWDVSNVSDMTWMFYGASKFNQLLADWSLNAAVDLNFIFGSTAMSDENLCVLKSAGSQWLEQWDSLGK